MWLCAADLRREDDDYDTFLELHRRDELLPGPDDAKRLEDEALLELASWIRETVPDWVSSAHADQRKELRFRIPGGACAFIFAKGAGELWLALPTLLAEELGMADPIRGLIVATVTNALGGAEVTAWETRSDWPTGRRLRNYELAYVWVK
jgi:hypothetical protein